MLGGAEQKSRAQKIAEARRVGALRRSSETEGRANTLKFDIFCKRPALKRASFWTRGGCAMYPVRSLFLSRLKKLLLGMLGDNLSIFLGMETL